MAAMHPRPTVARRPSRLGPRSAGVRMSAEEFDAVPFSRCDPRFRYELINGVLVVSPTPVRGERDPNDELGFLLRLYQQSHPQGSALDLTLPEEELTIGGNRRRPDRVVWAGLGRLPAEDEIPTIVVEFVSKDRRDFVRDYQEKAGEYRSAGVAEYWIIDRFRRTMTVHKNTTTPETPVVVAEPDTYRTDRLPGFELPLARLLATADRWSASKSKSNATANAEKSRSAPRPHPRRSRRDQHDG